jgi:hypothetical protein
VCPSPNWAGLSHRVFESFDHVERVGGEEMGGAGGRGGVKEQLPSEFESESSSLSPIPTSLICSSSDSIDERASSSPSTGPRTSSTSSFSPASTNAELVCDYSDCGRIFSKRHDLK